MDLPLSTNGDFEESTRSCLSPQAHVLVTGGSSTDPRARSRFCASRRWRESDPRLLGRPVLGPSERPRAPWVVVATDNLGAGAVAGRAAQWLGEIPRLRPPGPAVPFMTPPPRSPRRHG